MKLIVLIGEYAPDEYQAWCSGYTPSFTKRVFNQFLEEEPNYKACGLDRVTTNPLIVDLWNREFGPETIELQDENGGVTALLDAFDKDWLAHFSLGDLYMSRNLEKDKWKDKDNG